MSSVKHAPQLLLLLLFISPLIFISCEGEVPEPIDFGPVSEIIVMDNGNVGDASDIEVNFNKQLDLQNIAEYRLFALKSNRVANFGLEIAGAMASERYTLIQTDETYPVKGKELTAQSKDVDGDIINANESYRFAILTVAEDSRISENTLAISEQDFQLTVNNLLIDHTREQEIGAGSLLMGPSGQLWMGDYNIQRHVSENSDTTYRLYRITDDGSFIEESTEYQVLAGNAFDSEYNLYQSDILNARILRRSPAGVFDTLIANDYPLFQPDGIYVDPNKNIFVADQEAGNVVKIDSDGVSSQFAFVGKSPRGITADTEGNLYVSHNHENGEISKVSADGTVSILATIPVSRPEGYVLPYKMWMGYIIFHEGFLYVAGMSSDRIYKVSLTGEVEVFAGSGNRGIPRGGVRTANLNRPLGLAFSADSKKLYISGCTDVTPSHTQYTTPGIIWEIDIVE
ncbi:MAG: SMP-30/gluconolactonase/LRE family protein [Bacteroidia bacterium]|nr:SMP-30/gluconolactonase/LRE family protein [Bacteroidia bacterium]